MVEHALELHRVGHKRPRVFWKSERTPTPFEIEEPNFAWCPVRGYFYKIRYALPPWDWALLAEIYFFYNPHYMCGI